MATRRSENINNKISSPKAGNPSFLTPDFSDDPHFTSMNTMESKIIGEKNFLSPRDQKLAHDLSLSSLQTSTQHSINFKNSFCGPSPKRSFSISKNLNFHHNKTDSIRTSLRLEDKLKDLEHSSVLRHSEFIRLEEDEDFVTVPKAQIREPISFEGPDDLKIPQLKWCAYCKAEVMTKVSYVNTSKTFWSAVGIFLTGGVFGCFMLPYMTNSCKGARIHCHRCERVLA